MPIDEGARKKIIISVVALVLAGGITVFMQIRGGNSNKGLLLPDRVLKCRQCSHIVSPSSEELKSMITERDGVYLEQLAQSNPDQVESLKKVLANREGARSMSPNNMAIIPDWGGMNWPFTCPSCNQDTFYFASKCPKCGETYFDFDEQGNYSDKCPKCGYSTSEEIKRRSQDKKASERAKRTEQQQKQRQREKELE